MCGIYGLFSKYRNGLSATDLNIAKQMAIITSLRGDHSSGIAVARRNLKDKPWIARVLGDPFNLFLRKTFLDDFDDLLKTSHGSMGFFGHGRYATRGKITVENAHPFSEGTITMVHNGTINSGVDMTAKTADGTDVEVDSHALAISMGKHGIGKALAMVNGAYAVIVHNQDDGCFYFAHNKERPLHYFEANGKLAVMSEFGALACLLDRNNRLGAPAADWEKRKYVIEEFKVDTLYKYDPDKLCLTEVEDLKATRQALVPASAAPFRNSPPKSGSTTSGSGQHGKASSNQGYQFLCTGIRADKNGPNYLYDLELEDGTKAYTSTNVRDENYIGRIGTAQKLIVTKRKNVVKERQVKFRTIEWHPRVDVLANAVANAGGAANTAPFDEDVIIDQAQQSFNGVYITKGVFLSKAKTGCAICQGDMVFEDVAQTYVLGQDQGMVCYDCIKSGAAAGYGLNVGSA